MLLFSLIIAICQSIHSFHASCIVALVHPYLVHAMLLYPQGDYLCSRIIHITFHISHCRARAGFFRDRQQLKRLLLSVKRRNPENSVIVLHGSAIDRLMMVCCCDCHGRLVGITAKAQGNISQALCVISSCFAHSATPALQGAALSLPDDSLLLQLLWRAQERPTAASICCHGRALLSGWCPGSLNS